MGVRRWAGLCMWLAATVHCGQAERSTDPARQPSRPGSWIDLTVAGVPPEDRALLVAPNYGFPIDVLFPAPDEVVPESTVVTCVPWSGEAVVELREPVHLERDRATFVVTRERALVPGSYKLVATVGLVSGGSESVTLDLAVRRPTRPPPLVERQWIHLDFDVDRDGDAMPDFPADLAEFGLASGISAAVDILVESWVIDEIVARAQAFYDAPNPSGLPGGDPIPVHFSAEPSDAGPYTRICVAGATPEGGSIIGNAMLDPGNGDPADDVCDDYLPSGVFPRELTWYRNDPVYRQAFEPLQARPAGTDARDVFVLGATYRADDPAQRERYEVLRRGVETFAQAVASVAAHEAGHAMGLVPPGTPGRGLFGGEEGTLFTHNLTRETRVPSANLLMNPGPTFRFEDLVGVGEVGLPRIRALNHAYLKGRLLLDPTIDGIYMPPAVVSVRPSRVERDAAPVALIEISGSHFRSPPSLTLHGLASYGVPQAGILPGRDGRPDTLMASLLVPGLLPGVYDIEIANPDGQSVRVQGAIEIR